MKILCSLLLILSLGCLLPAAVAEEPKPEKEPARAYRLDYTIEELESGKVVNARTYSLLVDDQRHSGRTKVGSRVPVAIKQDQFQYMDVGLNLDARVFASGEDIMLETNINMTSLAMPEQATSGSPVVRNMESGGSTIIAAGKSTVVSEVDDVQSKRRYRVSVLVTRLK